ncbi:MAG TPA: septum formation initiator family protein [Chloroflexota bacterium]|nr:septum formation initiator family protein [Chloroflexota bacterium]
MAAVRGANRVIRESLPARPDRRIARLGFVLLAVSALFFGVSFARESLVSRQIEANAARLQQEIAAANAQNSQLESEITYLGSKSYVMTEARSKLGMAQPGDTQVHVVVGPPRVKVVKVPVPAEAPHEGLFISLLRAIFQ